MTGETESRQAPDSSYTADIYFHGIGEQRRYEETSRLIDSPTGASSGIGRATARLLADRGVFVVLGARNEDALAATASEIASAGGKAVFKATDVRIRTDLETLVALALNKAGRLDAIVNNAGIGPLSRRSADRPNLEDGKFHLAFFDDQLAIPDFYDDDYRHLPEP